MSTFVLVHGTWQSSGTWDRLTPLLAKHGHHVITPLLRGLGTDQRHLSSDTSLSQHVKDVSRALRRFFEPFATKARTSGWTVAELDTGYDCHFERPDEVANILLSAARPQ